MFLLRGTGSKHKLRVMDYSVLQWSDFRDAEVSRKSDRFRVVRVERARGQGTGKGGRDAWWRGHGRGLAIAIFRPAPACRCPANVVGTYQSDPS